MPSFKLIHIANQIHQYINYIWWLPPIRWSNNEHRWHYRRSIARSYLISSILFKIAINSCSLSAYTYGWTHPNSLTTTHMVTLFMDMFGMSLFILTDFIIVTYGVELALCANWATQKEAWLIRYGKLIYIKRMSISQLKNMFL